MCHGAICIGYFIRGITHAMVARSRILRNSSARHYPVFVFFCFRMLKLELMSKSSWLVSIIIIVRLEAIKGIIERDDVDLSTQPGSGMFLRKNNRKESIVVTRPTVRLYY